MAITIEECKNLKHGQLLYFVQMYETVDTYLDDKGRIRAVSKPVSGNKVRHFRVSGKVKTWKTRPNDVKVPIKYGLYCSAYVGTIDDCEPLERFYLSEEEAANAELPPVIKGKIGTKEQIKNLEKCLEA